MPSQQYWKIYDTATGETDDWDLVVPLPIDPTLQEVSDNINQAVIAGKGIIGTDVWDAWGYDPLSWDSSAKILVAGTFPKGPWHGDHKLTATLINKEQL